MRVRLLALVALLAQILIGFALAAPVAADSTPDGIMFSPGTNDGLAIDDLRVAQSAQAGPAQADLDATCPASLPFGAVLDCSVTAAGEIDTYTFSATINDRLLVSVLRTSGTLDPYVRVVKPNGVDDACARYTYSDLVSFECSLTLGGSFTLRVSDTGGANTGDYQAYVQRLPQPGGTQALSYGTPVSGTLASVIQADTRTFVAKQNDIINLRMFRTAGAIDPYFNVYDAQGNSLADCSTYTYSDLIGRNCAITADGTYTVMIGDTGQDHAGSYRFFIQRLNNPGGASPLAFGSPVSSAVGESAELDVYTFTAQTNDLLMIHLVQASGSLDPQFQLYNAAGSVVCDNYTYSAITIDDACAITAGGTYALMIDDAGNVNTGSYKLYVQRLNNPGSAQALSSGQTVPGNIDAPGAFRSYQISAARDSELDLAVSITGGTLDPYVRIYSQGGTKVCERYTYSESLSLKNCVITADGLYTLILSDAGNQNVGTYSIYLAPILTPRLYLPVVRR